MASVGDTTQGFKRARVKTERMQEFEKSQEDPLTQKILKCSKEGCDKVFTSVPGLRYHTKTHVEPDRRFVCEKCEKSFKSFNGLKYHKFKTKCCEKSIEEFTDDDVQDDALLSLCKDVDVSDLNQEHTDSKAGCEEVLLTDYGEPEESKFTSLSKPAISSSWLNKENLEVNRLQQLAIIATGPESPLLKAAPPVQLERPSGSVVRSLEQSLHSHAQSGCGDMFSFGENSEVTPTGPKLPLFLNQKSCCLDGSDPRVTSSSPCPTSPKDTCNNGATWSHSWPTAVWQCFIKGTKVKFVSGFKTTWQLVEEIAHVEFLKTQASCLQEGGASMDGYAPKGLRLLYIEIQDEDNEPPCLQLQFTPDMPCQPELVAACPHDHPFFVLEKGWSSYFPSLTVKHYGIPCRELEENDVCLPPSHPDATFAHNVFESTNSLDFTPQYSSAVLALSSMAKQRRVLEDSQKSGLVSQERKPQSTKGDSLKAKRPMNGFMLFAKKHRLEYTQMYPGKDNRAISVLLGDKWKKMKTEEKNIFAQEAKQLADQQKKMHPDCWKRKAVKSW